MSSEWQKQSLKSAHPISHQAISASAGSGKTFRLSHRYINLLADNISPDRICALTFSRKAAGEIFDSVVEYLCEAASSSKNAKETAGNIGRAEMGQQEFGKLLRLFLDNLHRMHIGTLDSFMIGIAKTFPAELGISPDFQVMDNGGAMALEIRNSILAQIFDPRSCDNESRSQFIKAFKQATFGQEEKSPSRQLMQFIDKGLMRYQESPFSGLWGNLGAMGLDKYSWLALSIDPGKVSAELIVAVESSGFPAKPSKRFVTFAEDMKEFRAGIPWAKGIEYFFPRLIEVLPDLEKGHAYIKIEGKELELSASVCKLLLQLVRYVLKCEVSVSIARTAGLYQILDLYEKRYTGYTHQTGQLTFNDAQLLLTETNPATNRNIISRENDSPEKLYIDYRLDCKLDHWLLDEFQDTSDLQWSVLKNLADEVLQDQSGERSFFYVGDVKQAIYAWRGGNASLFNKILQQYGDNIELLPMNISYRSCPTVIETVNDIFSDLKEGDGLKSKAVNAWHKIWREHESAQRLKDVAGYTALIEPVEPEGKSFKSSDRYDVVAAILNEMQPVKRQIDVAVLISTNNEGAAVVDHLRRKCPGIPVVHEGNATITDNPVVSLLLSLLQVVAHPGDTLALKHIQMSPLTRHSKLLNGSGYWFGKQAPYSLCAQILESIHTNGFQYTIRHWGNILAESHPLDAFGKSRLASLIEAAAIFDETSNRNIDEFIRFAEKFSIKEQSSTNAIRVMTIHQSKGLGFDVVICPELQGKSMVSEGKLGLTTASDPVTDEPNWVLEMPKRLVASGIPVLGEHLDKLDNETCYNALCRLYVAVTRAKKALYLVTSKAGKTSKAQNAAAFIKSRLVGEPNPEIGEAIPISGYNTAILYQKGSHDWFEAIPEATMPDSKEALPDLADDFSNQKSIRSRLERIEPSTQKEVITKASHVFAVENREVLDFGNAIHGMFEAVEWIDNFDPESVIAEWLKTSTFNAAVNRDSCQQFREAVVKPEVKQALSRPEGNLELWREKSFEVVLDGKWMTGQFDRVTIIRNECGKPISATILDYKSNRIDQPAQFEEAADHYRPQLELYGEAISYILKIPSDSIRMQLLFTRAGKLVEL